MSSSGRRERCGRACPRGARVSLACVTAALGVALLLATSACTRLDAAKELSLSDLETYWVIDASSGQMNYIAPAVRFKVHNKGSVLHRSIEASATFRRVGEETVAWGSGWCRVTPRGKALKPGEDALVVITSDGRYNSQGTPEQMFKHQLFKDARVEVYLRVGSSTWAKMADVTVDRRIGAHSVEAFAGTHPSGP